MRQKWRNDFCAAWREPVTGGAGVGICESNDTMSAQMFETKPAAKPDSDQRGQNESIKGQFGILLH